MKMAYVFGNVMEYNIDNVKMETPKNSRSSGSNKFLIKAKPSVTHLRSQNSDPEIPVEIDQEVQLFLKHMIYKSKRIKQLLHEKKVTNEQQFNQKHLYQSACLKTILKTVLDRMFVERRLGKNLKGLNKDNAAQIENQIWSCLLREIELYKNQKEYQKSKTDLQSILAQRKMEIMQELNKLREKSNDPATK